MLPEVKNDDVEDSGVPYGGNCIKNDPLNKSVLSAMLTTMYIQMGITVAAGVLIHILAGTLMNIGELVAIFMMILGGAMYLYAIGGFVFVIRLQATDSSPLPSLTDPSAIVQILVAHLTERTRILRCFSRYNFHCCIWPAFVVFITTAVAFVFASVQVDLVISLGLVAFAPLVTFSIYNHTMLGKYTDRLQRIRVLEGILSQETQPMARRESDGGV